MTGKKFFIVLLLVCTVAFLFGCQKSIPDPEPLTEQTSPSASQTENTAMADSTQEVTEGLTEDVIEGVTGDVTETNAEKVTTATNVPTPTAPCGGYYPRVLMYHCVNETPTTENTLLFVRPSELEDQFRFISDNGLETLFAEEFSEREEKSVILTFDDGYEDNYTYMFPLAKKYSVKVTVYLIAYKIDMPGYLSSNQIKEMQDSGLVRFGSHTLDHPDLPSLSEADLRKQFEGSNWIISKVTGKEPATLAYPTGLYDSTVAKIAGEYYSFAYTMDDEPYTAQNNLMLPRYAILREHTLDQFKIFIGY